MFFFGGGDCPPLVAGLVKGMRQRTNKDIASDAAHYAMKGGGAIKLTHLHLRVKPIEEELLPFDLSRDFLRLRWKLGRGRPVLPSHWLDQFRQLHAFEYVLAAMDDTE